MLKELPKIIEPIRIYRSLALMKFRDCTSMNSAENIQEGYRNGLLKTALEFENCSNYLRQPYACAYQRALQLPEPRLITRSQLGRFLQKVTTINFRDQFFSF